MNKILDPEQTNELLYDCNDEQSLRAYRRAGCAVVKLYNGWKDGSLSGERGQHVTFTSDERFQESFGIRGTAGLISSVRISIIEDVAAEVAAFILDFEAAGWPTDDLFYGLDPDITEDRDLTIGAQVEQKLRLDACAGLAIGAGDEQQNIWAFHIFRLGQLSVRPDGCGRIEFDGNIPNHFQLVQLYNECAEILLQFWPQVEQLAAALQDGTNTSDDPVMPLVPFIFNKRFTTDTAGAAESDRSMNQVANS